MKVLKAKIDFDEDGNLRVAYTFTDANNISNVEMVKAITEYYQKTPPIKIYSKNESNSEKTIG